MQKQSSTYKRYSRNSAHKKRKTPSLHYAKQCNDVNVHYVNALRLVLIVISPNFQKMGRPQSSFKIVTYFSSLCNVWEKISIMSSLYLWVRVTRLRISWFWLAKARQNKDILRLFPLTHKYKEAMMDVLLPILDHFQKLMDCAIMAVQVCEK